MNDLILERLRCPLCQSAGKLTEDRRSFVCCGPRRHLFDFSKSGYLNLARAGQAGTGDAKQAIRARSAFLDAGYYQPLADALCAILDRNGVGFVVDAGCGEGYYTDRMAAGRVALGVDLSVAGIDHAAKRAKKSRRAAGYAVASLFSLPIADASSDAVVSVFAPAAEEEFLRVLRPGGILVLVGAGERHLLGLKQQLYRTTYLNPGREDLPQSMTLEDKEVLSYPITVEGTEAIESLFSMTPYYWRTSREDHAKIRELTCLNTPLEFDIFVFRKNSTDI